MKKIICTISIMVVFLSLLFIAFVVLIFTGKIQDYTYLNINKDNKDNIINLLKEQEENMFMFNMESSIDLNACYNNIERIEVIYLFPDGEEYVIYCQEDKLGFALDNPNYALPNYITENGHIGFRFN